MRTKMTYAPAIVADSSCKKKGEGGKKARSKIKRCTLTVSFMVATAAVASTTARSERVAVPALCCVWRHDD